MGVKQKYCQKGHELIGDNVRYRTEKGKQKRYCIICNREYHRTRLAKIRQKRFMDNPEWASRYYRDRKLKENYKISLETFEKMISDQDNKCFICKREFSNDIFSLKPCVDHCHYTGIVRKILCHPCNRALGLLKENTEVLRGMADYIESYQ